MNNTIDEAIEILQAMKKRNTIQVQELDVPFQWHDKIPDHLPNFRDRTYRIKPKLLEAWVNVYQDGSKRMWATEEDARRSAKDSSFIFPRIAVHMCEVVE